MGESLMKSDSMNTKTVIIKMVVVTKEAVYEDENSQARTDTTVEVTNTTVPNSTNLATSQESKDYSRFEERNIISEERWKQILLQIKEALRDDTSQKESYSMKRRRKSLPVVPKYSDEELRKKQQREQHFLNFLSCWSAVFD